MGFNPFINKLTFGKVNREHIQKTQDKFNILLSFIKLVPVGTHRVTKSQSITLREFLPLQQRRC